MKPLLYLNDDAQCIELLKQAGKLDILAVPPGKYSATACFDYDGKWCMATRFENHDIASENGYTVIMIPKDVCSKEEAAALFMDILEKCIGRENMQFVEKEV